MMGINLQASRQYIREVIKTDVPKGQKHVTQSGDTPKNRVFV